MAEAFELVRIVRQHIRRSATLLDQGKLAEALAAADAALALDPQSLPAQAMRERITLAQGASSRAAKSEVPAAPAVTASTPFVPHGVNAASWRGFEQRITERRFKALLDAVNTSIVAGDGAAARAALDEARELRPDATVLAEFEARVAGVPAAPPAANRPSPRIWMRAMGAAALFLIGVSMLLGLEWMRPEATPTGAAKPPVAAPALPAAAPRPAPTQDAPPAISPNLGSVPLALNDEEETVPAVVTPPEPLLRPAGTSGAETPSSTPVSSTPAPMPPAREPTRTVPAPAIASARPEPIETAPEPRVADDSIRTARREVPDDFVAARQTAPVTSDAAPAAPPPSRTTTLDVPVSATARGPAAPAAASVAPAAISIPSGVEQQTRVEEVLRRYARAYDRLDASAAREVWPTVDERALARAFQNLSSQNVSFDDCAIDIRGAVANASCRGQASYAPKVGNREPRTEARNWRFELRREGDAWQIVGVDARR